MQKKFNIHILPSAEKSLQEIHDYISNKLRNPDSADKLIDDFAKEFKTIAKTPNAFPKVDYDKFDRDYYKCRVRNFVGFFTVDEGKGLINIERIYYGKRDIENLLKENK